MAGSLLTIKVTNGQVDLGVFEGSQLLGRWSGSSGSSLMTDEAEQVIEAFLTLRDIDNPESAILCSVVPSATMAWEAAARHMTGNRPLVVGPGLKSGIAVRYKDPGQVGSDRVANAVAARELYGAPCIAVDFGSATNIVVVDEKGAFVGGAIAPGLGSSMRALNMTAAQLPGADVRVPENAIGRTTAEAVQAGVVLGEAKRLDGLVEAIWDELGYDTELVATGRYAPVVCEASNYEFTQDGILTLQGLRLIFELNKKRRAR